MGGALMLRLIAFLITGCWHKWDTVESGTVHRSINGQTVGLWWHERCHRCGVNRYRKGR